MPGGELGLCICNLPLGQLDCEQGQAFMGALGVDRMEEPVVEMEGDMEVVDAEFKARDQ